MSVRLTVIGCAGKHTAASGGMLMLGWGTVGSEADQRPQSAPHRCMTSTLPLALDKCVVLLSLSETTESESSGKCSSSVAPGLAKMSLASWGHRTPSGLLRQGGRCPPWPGDTHGPSLVLLVPGGLHSDTCAAAATRTAAEQAAHSQQTNLF